MDWQTKEWVDSRFDELEEKLDAIMQHLNITDPDELDDLDEAEEDSQEDITIQ